MQQDDFHYSSASYVNSTENFFYFFIYINKLGGKFNRIDKAIDNDFRQKINSPCCVRLTVTR